jgi:hypothetical protein
MPILFKKRFFAAIVDGTKTTTIRLWRRPMVRPGQLAAVPFLARGRLRIDAVEPLGGLDELADADAAADGFDSLAAMLAELAAIYPQLLAGVGDRKLYRVRFHFVPCGRTSRPRRPRKEC